MGTLVAMPQRQEGADIFEDAWLLYPRHIKKKTARIAWARIPESEYTAIVVAIVAWRSAWRNKDEQFIPHFSTWLNGEQWTDELPYEPRSNHASHVPAAIPISGERSAMPEHVRALLAKLRAK